MNLIGVLFREIRIKVGINRLDRFFTMKGYGFSLRVVYLVCAGIILLLYPFCKIFESYKSYHEEKCWLDYL